MKYPDKTLEKKLQELNVPYTLCWEIKGPSGTGVAWIQALAVNGRIVIIQTYEGGGWNAYTDTASLDVDETIIDVLRRVGLNPVI